METPIDEFHQQFHKQEIQKLTLHLKYLHILGTLHCVNSLQDEFKRRAVYHSVLCCQDYAEHVLASFAHQIQSEYYDGNRSVSIEGIEMENFSATDK